MKETIPTTFQVIADAIHVSRSTVSRVLNAQWKEHGISASTALKITTLAKDLRYIKNEAARSLRSKKTFTIGVIIRDITNPFYSQLVKFVESSLYANGYTIIICNTGYDLDKENVLINVLLSRRVDGIILSPIQKSIENISIIKDRNVPLALFDCMIDDFETASMLLPNPLTVIRQPLQEMALNAVDLLLSRIDKTNNMPYVTSMLKTEFVIRNSTRNVN